MELEIPVVDLDQSFEESAKVVKHACERHGFFAIKGIPTEITSRALDYVKRFFALSEEEKHSLVLDVGHGYIPYGLQTLDPKHQTRGDMKEVFAIGPEKPVDSESSIFGSNKWPTDEQLPGFRKFFEEYRTLMHDTSVKLSEMIGYSLGMPADYFSYNVFEGSASCLRPVHYFPEKSDPEHGVLGAGAHSDWGMITLLFTGGQPGLQIFIDGQWWDVKEPRGTLVCNIGNMLERWSNSKYKSTRHRVVNKNGLDRYSIPYFLNPKPSKIIATLPTCGTPKFEEITCEDYIDRMYDATGPDSLPT
uniref:Fe2OG dioxygenase domain-containing protein n=1 Tax=Rhodosorus marinus TaxID=101924 RepID=A0A7S0BDQ9_9RHOD|mmetsp:Transcript_11243/g.16253  ORF Transcript_11243/g.16253 Transcript_11243/m.16253 type:complete len:304 (+) Transcript_11243:502-1413(+)